MFRKLDLYRTSKQKSYDWQCSKYPDYAIIHSILTNQRKTIDPNTGRELSIQEQVIALQECQLCQSCPKKKLRKDLVEEKLKPALNGSFTSTFPPDWISEMETHAKKGDVAFQSIQKKEELISNSAACSKYLPSTTTYMSKPMNPRSTELHVPTKEDFEMEKQLLKYQLCINSMMCANSIKKCMASIQGENAQIENRHFSTCLAFDKNTINCVNSI
nr:unnamed protein product [Naegleria fowleri]